MPLGEAFWGMLVGVRVYAEVYSYVKDGFLKWADLGKLSIPQAIGIGYWIILPIMWRSCFCR